MRYILKSEGLITAHILDNKGTTVGIAMKGNGWHIFSPDKKDYLGHSRLKSGILAAFWEWEVSQMGLQAKN